MYQKDGEEQYKQTVTVVEFRTAIYIKIFHFYAGQMYMTFNHFPLCKNGCNVEREREASFEVEGIK